jgi:hypothetical protein
MSVNPQTYYTTINQNSHQVQDLSGIFQPLSLGTPYTTATGFKTKVSGVEKDFNQIFAAGNNLGYNVGYKLTNGTDLSQIFAKYNPLTITVTNINTKLSYYIFNQNNYTIYQFNTANPSTSSYNTGTCTVTFSVNLNISVILVGGGGGGGISYNTLSGGGGGGGSFSLNNVSVTANTPYQITIGSGGTMNFNSYQDGQASSFIGGAINITGSGGGRGKSPNYDNGSQAGGTSINGGNGGNGTTPSAGSNGTYKNYVTAYGSTLNIGGGGGGGRNSSNPNSGNGAGANNGTGGAQGVNNVYPVSNGFGYGAGGGGAQGVVAPYTGTGLGGYGASGVVIFYYLN